MVFGMRAAVPKLLTTGLLLAGILLAATFLGATPLSGLPRPLPRAMTVTEIDGLGSVGPAATLSASVTPLTLDLGQNVSFEASMNGGVEPIQYTWHMGNGVTLSGPSGAYEYPASGSYTVGLWANDSASHFLSENWTVEVDPAPVLDAAASVTSTDAGRPVNFTAALSQGVLPYSYSWSFGSGASATGAAVEHIYEVPGTVRAYLNATDGAGVVRSWNTTLEINANVSVMLRASMNVVTTADVVDFTTTVAGGTAPETFAWVFADGSTSAETNPAHLFSNPGTYLVRVWVNDSVGGVATANTTITVSQAVGTPGEKTNQSSPPPYSPSIAVLVSLAALLGLVLLYLVYRYRGRSPPPSRPLRRATPGSRKVRIRAKSSSAATEGKEEGAATPEEPTEKSSAVDPQVSEETE